jgi:hypothetical protein
VQDGKEDRHLYIHGLLLPEEGLCDRLFGFLQAEASGAEGIEVGAEGSVVVATRRTPAGFGDRQKRSRR